MVDLIGIHNSAILRHSSVIHHKNKIVIRQKMSRLSILAEKTKIK